jgi:hypothetical protein
MRTHRYATAVLLTMAYFAPAHGQHTRPQLPAAQRNGQAQRSVLLTAPVARQLEHDAPLTWWANKVRGTAARQHRLPEVQAIKDAKWAAKVNAPMQKEVEAPVELRSVVPQIGVDFEANWSTQQTPPDNSLAISNGGLIVSANNDGIVYADDAGAIAYAAFWPDFFNDPSLNANIYDPKVIYDSGSDRFFMTVLHGSTASTSLVLLCFSQTNDPNDGWWIYQLTGNPLADNSWFDYPGIGVSNNEVYVTGNLFSSGANQFNQAVVYQIEKAAGYAGNNLNWSYWYGLGTSPYVAFTLVPASWGQQGNYGPGILFVSGSAGGSNSLRLFDLTDDLSGSPQLNDYTVSVNAYSPAANAQMPGNPDQLDNGDNRMLGAFYLNNTLHCVFHGDVGSGWNGIVYKRINVNNLSVTQSTFGTPGVADLSYPAMASFAAGTSDPSVMIAYLRSSTAVNPEVRVVNCDASMQWSTGTLVKGGETFVDFLTGAERWGDYTGMARRHNGNNPEVWLAGCYGANVSGVLNNTWKTWIAEVGGGSVGLEEAATEPSGALLYPVPAMDLFNLNFTVTERAVHTIQLHDMKGALVKVLYQETPSLGEHQLTFNRGQLAPGHYILSITTPTTRIAHEDLLID